MAKSKSGNGRPFKALPSQCEEYLWRIPKPVYPLWGYIEIADQTGKRHMCFIEDLRKHWSKEDPQYEVIAPKGFHFRGRDTHTALCLNQKDIMDECYMGLEPCGPHCK